MQLGLHYRFHLWMPETQVTSYRDYLLRVWSCFSCWWVQMSGDLSFPSCFNSLW